MDPGKRSLNTTSKNSPKRKKQNRSDKFCWLCHRPNGGLRGCSKCFRVFHRDCLVLSNGQPVEIKSPSEWLCDECIGFNNRKQENSAQINILLNYLLNKVNNVQEYSGLGLAIRSNRKIVQPMDIETIQIKIKNNEYDSTLGLLADVKLMQHCAEIVSANEINVLKRLKTFGEACINEMYDLNSCQECYKNSHENRNWFTLACKVPHLLVWARTTGYPYWPAKILDAQGTKTCVKYFGDHARSLVSQDNILLFSADNPNKNLSAKSRKLIEEVIPEVKLYIKNIIEVYGHFNYAPVGSKFTVNEIGLCLKRMVDPITAETETTNEELEFDTEFDVMGSERIEETVSLNIEHIDGVIEEEISTRMSPNAPSFADGIIANNSMAKANFNDISNNLDQAETNSTCNSPLLRMDATFFGSEREIGLIQYIGDYIQDEINLRNQTTKQLDDNQQKCQAIQQELDANNTKLLTLENLNNDLSLKFQTIQLKKAQLEANLSAITEQYDSMKADITAKNDVILQLTDQKGQLNAELLQADDRDLKFQGLIDEKNKLIGTMKEEKTKIHADLSKTMKQNDLLKADATAKYNSIVALTAEKGKLEATLLDIEQRELKMIEEIADKDKLTRSMKGERTTFHADLSTTTEQNDLLKAHVTAKDSLIVALTAEKFKLEANLLDTEQRELKLKGEIADKDNVIRSMAGKQNKCEDELLIATEQGDKFRRELEAKDKSIQMISFENQRFEVDMKDAKAECEALKLQLGESKKSLLALSDKYDASQVELLRYKELLYNIEEELVRKEEMFGVLIKTTHEDVTSILEEKFKHIKARILNEFEKLKSPSSQK